MLGSTAAGLALRRRRRRKTADVTAAIAPTVTIAAMKAQFGAKRATIDCDSPTVTDCDGADPVKSPDHPAKTYRREEGRAVSVTTSPGKTKNVPFFPDSIVPVVELNA